MLRRPWCVTARTQGLDEVVQQYHVTVPHCACFWRMRVSADFKGRWVGDRINSICFFGGGKLRAFPHLPVRRICFTRWHDSFGQIWKQQSHSCWPKQPFSRKWSQFGSKQTSGVIRLCWEMWPELFLNHLQGNLLICWFISNHEGCHVEINCSFNYTKQIKIMLLKCCNTSISPNTF